MEVARKGRGRRRRVRDRSKVREQIVRTVAAHLGVRPSQVPSNGELRQDLGADLLDRIELAVAVEEQFSVRLPYEAVLGVRTVEDLVGLLLNACKDQEGGKAEC